MLRWVLCLPLGLICCVHANTPTAPTEVIYKSPIPAGNAFLSEHFDDEEQFHDKWVFSEAKKDGSDAGYDGKFEIGHSEDENRLRGDSAMVLQTKARHHAISVPLSRPFIFDHRPLIVQYDVQFMNGLECGGAYLKLLSQSTDGKSTPELLKSFNDKTLYSIMFGPDKCGMQQKLHFIIQHRNPKTGAFEEKHWKEATNAGNAMNGKFGDVFTDKKPHQFTLILNPDNTFEIQIDGRREAKGHLLEDMDPPVNPPKEIEDKDDQKPEDWDEREKIADPEATKPEDWDEDQPKEIADPKAEKPIGWLEDEPSLIPDPEATRPTDWDEDMDGTWEAPLVDNPKCKDVGCGEWKPPMMQNPKYKGKWRPPMIDNPAYKGKWRPRKIPNPDYFEDTTPFRLQPVVALGFELWSMADGILFDNLLITDDMAVSKQWSEDGFQLKRRMLDKGGKSMFDNAFEVFVDYSTQYPWLWAVYVLALGIPVALIISHCCMSKNTTDDEPARRKKSDLEGDEEPLMPPENEKAEEDQPGAASGDTAERDKSTAGRASTEQSGEEESAKEQDEVSKQGGGGGGGAGARQRRKARKD